MKLFLVFCWLTIAVCAQDIVTIQNGQIQGKRMITPLKGVEFLAYQGIPYAKPPIGDLRFELPQPPDNWSGIYNATYSRSMCLQQNAPIGSEDCLYLNVFVPTSTDNCSSSQNPLPVMAVIHGGAFNYGESSYETMNQANFMEIGCIIVVAFNYRLGCFGFLSSGKADLPGNFGLHDQRLALQWIQGNIAQFNGDRNKVTLVGQSAGAASVALFLETQDAGVLFHAAIIQSGSSFSDWSRDRSQATTVYQTLVQAFSPAGLTTSQIKQQLKSVPAEELQTVSQAIAISNYLIRTPRDGLVFAPVNEPPHPTAFKTWNTTDSWEKGVFKPNVTVLMGSTRAVASLDFLTLALNFLALKEQWNIRELTPISMNEDDLLKRTLIGNLIRNEYNFPLIPASLPDPIVTSMLNDDTFYRPITKAAMEYIRNGLTVYFYIFSYCGDIICMNRTVKDPNHCEELLYLYSDGMGMTARDLAMRDTLGKCWVNFVKNHNPSEAGVPFAWPSTDSSLRYLNISDNPVMVNSPWRKSFVIDFWQTLFNTSAHCPLDTY